MARVAHAMAMANPHITADVVEVQEFPDLAQRYQISGVPKTVISDRVQFLGAVPEEEFLAKVLEAAGLEVTQEGTASEAPTSSF